MMARLRKRLMCWLRGHQWRFTYVVLDPSGREFRWPADGRTGGSSYYHCAHCGVEAPE